MVWEREVLRSSRIICPGDSWEPRLRTPFPGGKVLKEEFRKEVFWGQCFFFLYSNEWVSKFLRLVNKIRTKHFLLCNLFVFLCKANFPDIILSSLYFTRWNIELYFTGLLHEISLIYIIKTIFNKINDQFNVMLRFRKLISKDTLLSLIGLYKGFVMPHFNYCSSVWHLSGARSTLRR